MKVHFKNKTPRILVVGDVMLDAYWSGSVSRISPEAPVPVLSVNKKEYVLGGAANVALNCKKMNAVVELIGIIGVDTAALEFVNVLKKAGNNIELSAVVDSSRPTTLKTRIVSNGQQIVRLDEEVSTAITTQAQLQAIEKYHKALVKNPDVIIISDYGKGFVTPDLCAEVIEEANYRNIPVLVDPKGKNYKKYTGATVLSPNKAELSLVTGVSVEQIDELIQKGQNLCTTLNCKNIVLTRSEEGISLLGSYSHQHFLATAKEVVDVCGAGDAVISALGVCLAHGMPIEDAVWASNVAGGIAVKKFGTSAVSLDELQVECALLSNQQLSQKIHFNDFVQNLSDVWHTKNEKIIFTNGCFDLFHIGHLKLLESCKALGTKLIVGLNSDSSVSALKGPKRPIIAQEQRAQVLAGLEVVDCVVIFNEETPLNLIEKIRPHVLVKGGDYEIDSIVGSAFVQSYGGQVEIVPLVDGMSTSNIINKIIENN